jgi:hypothetical protein
MLLVHITIQRQVARRAGAARLSGEEIELVRDTYRSCKTSLKGGVNDYGIAA